MGFRGRIHQLSVNGAGTGLPGPELERRLIELGFVEGADVEVLHEGLFGGDPDRRARRRHDHRAAPPRGHGDPGDERRHLS